MKLIDLLTSEERQQLRVRYDDASFPDYVNELLNKEVDTVKHGRWIDKGEYAVCTECGGHSGTQYDGLEPIALTSRFCPNCGAKMD